MYSNWNKSIHQNYELLGISCTWANRELLQTDLVGDSCLDLLRAWVTSNLRNQKGHFFEEAGKQTNWKITSTSSIFGESSNHFIYQKIITDFNEKSSRFLSIRSLENISFLSRDVAATVPVPVSTPTHFGNRHVWGRHETTIQSSNPIPSHGTGICTYIYDTYQQNLGKYTIHGFYG